MCPDMALEVKGVIEAFIAIGAEMPFHLAVALQVAVQHPLVGESFLANGAAELLSWPLTLSHLQKNRGFAVREDLHKGTQGRYLIPRAWVLLT